MLPREMEVAVGNSSMIGFYKEWRKISTEFES